MFTEVYLEQSWTFMMELFSKKLSLADIWLGSKYASGSLEAPCKMLPLNSFILQYLYHNQFAFCFWKGKHYIEKH